MTPLESESADTDQRYYASAYGRFLTADPYIASGGPNDPGSFNRYSYTRGDPANRLDPPGTCDVDSQGFANSDPSCSICDDPTYAYLCPSVSAGSPGELEPEGVPCEVSVGSLFYYMVSPLAQNTIASTAITNFLNNNCQNK